MRSSSSARVNRTGGSLAPELFADLVEATRGTQPSAPGDADKLARVRISYAERAEPTGSIPGPAEDAGESTVENTAAVMVFVDKLGERLAFERSGVRLYDALLSKFDAHGSWKGGPKREELEQIRAEELAHFLSLREIAQQLGADPTAVTPSANLHAVVGKGLPAALADPRTTLRDGLEAILVAELVDNDCWENLSDLAEALGKTELTEVFAEAIRQEREHLEKVRTWLANSLAIATGGSAFARRVEDRAAAAAVLDQEEDDESPEAEDEEENLLPDVGTEAGQRAARLPKAHGAHAIGRATTMPRGRAGAAMGARKAKPKQAGSGRNGGSGGRSGASARSGAARSRGNAKGRAAGKSAAGSAGKAAGRLSGKSASGKSASGKSASRKAASGKTASSKSASGRTASAGRSSGKASGGSAGAKASRKR